MAGYTRKLKQILRENGCYFHRQGRGDHEIWYSSLSGHYFTVDGSIKSRHTANKTLEDARLAKRFQELSP